MDYDTISYLSVYVFGAVFAGLAALAIHLTIQNHRIRALTQAGCFAFLVSPVVAGAGHALTVAPFWLAAWIIGQSLFEEPRANSHDIAWMLAFALVPTLLAWGVLLVPATIINNGLAKSAAAQRRSALGRSPNEAG
jgi:hypothetical protein